MVSTLVRSDRSYDPTTGTFLSPDPLDGVDGTPTVANPYHYTGNDPLNLVDPLGLKRVEDEELECRSEKSLLEELLDGEESRHGPDCPPMGGVVVTPGTATKPIWPWLVAGGGLLAGLFGGGDLDDLIAEQLFPQLSGGATGGYTRTDVPLGECMEDLTSVLMDGLPIPGLARAGEVSGAATTAVGIYCVDGQGGTAVAVNGSRPGPGFLVHPASISGVSFPSDGLGFPVMHYAEINLFGGLAGSLPMDWDSEGVIVAAADRRMCDYCRAFMRSFNNAFPCVSTAIADTAGGTYEYRSRLDC